MLIVTHLFKQTMMKNILNIVNIHPLVQAMFYKVMKTLQQKYEVLIKNRILVEKAILSILMPVNKIITHQKRKK